MNIPFSNEYIRNYMLFYGAVLSIVVLFFILNSLYGEIQTHEKKEFSKESSSKDLKESVKEVSVEKKYKLLGNVHQ
ncbi:MAG: hypothetical protein GQ570_14265 [Helicobacteraceae bacterium]|nr:hypothetical protein [Helicobacteraceae bacterium]